MTLIELKTLAEQILSPLGGVIACLIAIKYLAAENKEVKTKLIALIEDSIKQTQASTAAIEKMVASVDNLSDSVSRSADAVEYCKAKNQIISAYENASKRQ